ncbi:MAG: sulfatase-like hydrolase/transferase [Bacteroidetes bacterium]|nr:sulfatase-like hydrolase/transferase [Bacteroidota bacterium]
MNKPNILFFFTDDQRFSTVGAINNPQVKTPTMDYLVRKGTFFSRAYISGGTCPAVCMPSRAMLQTGRRLFSIKDSGKTIPEEHVLLGEHLQTAGYETFGIGKWHNGQESYTRSFSSGGEIFFGGMDDHWNVPVCTFQKNGNYPEPKNHPWDGGTGVVVETPKVYDHINKGKHSTDLFCDKAVDFLLSEKEEKPFFMYLSFMAPHDPRTMPTKFQTMYDPGKIVVPPNFMSNHPFDNGELDVRDEKLAARPRQISEIQKHLAEYYGMISHLDEGMGRVIDALKASGAYENTIIILTGDNGLALGSHGLMGKQNLYDHSIHVPLLMSGPDIKAGRISSASCYLYDIFPTLCDLLAIDTPRTVEGKSFKSVLFGETDTHRERMFFAYRGIQRAVQNDNIKFIAYLVDGTFRIQLFNLLVDPWEIKDLSESGEYETAVKSMIYIMIQEMESQGDPYILEWKESLKEYL